MLYFDTSYIVRLYTTDNGWEKVRELAKTDHIVCCLHGRAETISALHRKFREKAVTREEFRTLIEEFERDCSFEAFVWLPFSEAVVERITSVYRCLPSSIALRAADAIHLACAAEASCNAIYSNDKRLLEAAPHFSLAGENVI